MISSATIRGLTGEAAVELVKTALFRLPIRQCHVVAGCATVEYDAAVVDLAALEDAVLIAGCRVISWCSVPPSRTMDEYVLNVSSIPLCL